MNKSISYYRKASDSRNGQASYNMGLMYLLGDGLPIDYFLSKRYLDLAYTYEPNAFIPIKLTLIYLFYVWGLSYITIENMNNVTTFLLDFNNYYDYENYIILILIFLLIILSFFKFLLTPLNNNNINIDQNIILNNDLDIQNNQEEEDQKNEEININKEEEEEN
jgi:SNF family Na+-dependent transporter